MSSTKEFDIDLIEEYDRPARNAVRRLLKQRGWVAVANDDEYGPDLRAWLKNGYQGHGDVWVEVEVKNHWGSGDFPYATFHIAGRKAKWLMYPQPLVFVILNHDMTRAWACSSRRMSGVRLVQKDTVFTTQEWFIEVPATYGTFYTVPPA
jgi:hypothetical protein